MAQHDYNLANQSGADFRADLNNALSAIVTVNSGATAPSTTFAHQLWVDTSSNVLKIRNAANDAWVTTGLSITADNTFDINGGTVNGITALSFSTGASVTSILDEDNLGSDSATALATQQSIKAYVDSQIGSVDTLAEILLNGNATGGTNIEFGDNDKAIFGTGSDLQIYHNASDGASFIKESGSGHLRIQGSELLLEATNGDNFFRGIENGSVRIYHDNSTVLQTTSSGIDITGNATFDDNGKAIFGASNDLEIYHDGSSSYIVEQGQGSLIIRGGLNTYIQNTNGITMAAFGIGGTAQLRYNGGTKLVTNNTGIDITGTVKASTSLMVGSTDAPARDLEIKTTNPHIRLTDTDASGGYTEIFGGSGITTINADKGQAVVNSALKLSVDATDGLTINSNHNVDIPNGNLNVTGTVTSDQLVVDGNTSSQTYRSSRTDGDVYIQATTDTDFVKIGTQTKINALLVDGSGDISFYDDTGTTQGLFWDASAERLGIGTTSPSEKLTVAGIVKSNGFSTNTAGVSNFIAGVNAGSSIISGGEYNTLIGDEAGASITTGDFNVAVGNFALDANTTSSENTAIGYASLSNNITGARNVASGFRALQLNTASNDNTATGYFALYSTTGSNNTAIGKDAGKNITTGSKNTIIGSFNGNEGGLDIRTANNHIVLSDGDGNPRQVIDSSGKVGIGTSSPTETLHVMSGVSNDTVAIISGSQSDRGLTISTYASDGRTDGGVDLDAYKSFKFTTDGTERARIDSSGNLLVGTTSSTSGITATSGNSFVYRPAGELTIARQGSGAYSPVTILNQTGDDGQIIDLRKDGTTVGSIGTTATRLYIGSGDTGIRFIGDTDEITPWNTTTNAGRSGAIDLGNTGNKFKDLHLSGTGYFGTSVGIGTTSPTPFKSGARVLEIKDDAGSNDSAELILTNNSSMTDDEYVGSLIFKNTDSSGTPNHFAGLRAKSNSTFGRMDLEFYAGRSRMEDGTPDMVIIPNNDNQANVGIGTTSPSSTLEVNAPASNGIKISSTAPYLFFNDTDTAHNYDGSISQSGTTLYVGGATPAQGIVFRNKASFGESARFDTSGNLLVGTTNASGSTAPDNSSDTNNAGLRLSGSLGFIGIGSNSQPTTYLNRIGSDGDIAIFKKSGTTVGSIGTNSGQLYIGNEDGSTDTGLLFGESGTTARAIIPARADGSVVDGALDLGYSSGRFKDLHLSGTGYFGTSVGIGVSSPTSPLTVKSNSTGSQDAGFTLQANGSTNAIFKVGEKSNGKARLHMFDGTTEKIALHTDGTASHISAGNFGINTTSPAKQLHVYQPSGQTGIVLSRTNNIAGVNLQFSVDSSKTRLLSYGDALSFWTAATGSGTNASEKARFDALGNLLVGTTSIAPYASTSSTAQGISLRGDLGFIGVSRPNNSSAYFNRAGNDGSIIDLRKSGVSIGSIGTVGADVTIGTGDTGLRFRDEYDAIQPHNITTNGTVNGVISLGKIGAAFKDLHLSGTVNSTKYDIINEGGGSLYQTDGYLRFANGSTETVRITSSGELLLNKTSASVGTDGVQLRPSSYSGFSATSTTALFVNRNTTDGDVVEIGKNGVKIGSISVTSSAVAYNTSSDARLKDVTGEARGLEVITKLNPVAYNWKADGKADEGLIAQEVKEIVPNAVSGSEDEHYQMDYSKLVTPLVKAVQELEQQVTKLKSEIAKLKGE